MYLNDVFVDILSILTSFCIDSSAGKINLVYKFIIINFIIYVYIYYMKMKYETSHIIQKLF